MRDNIIVENVYPYIGWVKIIASYLIKCTLRFDGDHTANALKNNALGITKMFYCKQSTNNNSVGTSYLLINKVEYV